MKRLKFVLLAILAAVLVGALAGCKKQSVSYNFETNCEVQVPSAEVKIGEEYTLPVPTRDGYEFAGWYTTENFEGAPVVSVVASEGVTYYAKWDKLYSITLDLDGGSLPGAAALYLKAGANIYDYMQQYAPTKEGYVFGAWFLGEKELPRNERMTESGVTLTAKYKIGYTVETYLESLDGSAYVKSEELTTGYDYVGATVEPEVKVTGFTETTHQDAVTSKTLTANAGENVFKLYFNRDTYVLTFNANYPDGSASQNVTKTVKYGQEVEVLADYEFEGYILSGWATSANGQVLYHANFIESKLYNKTATTNVEPDKIKPERNMALYAIWDRGYTNMFDGDDYVFLNSGDDSVAYLVRGGVYFGGTYNPDTAEFIFRDAKNEIILRGKIVFDDTYAYRNLERDGFSRVLLRPGVGLDESVKIYFDQYNGVIYSVENEDGKTSDSHGAYSIDETGVYTATFTDGEMNGKSLVFIIGQVGGTDAFQLRNEEEYALKDLVRLAVSGGQLGAYYPELSLDGFGNATLHARDTSGNESTTTGSYSYSSTSKEIKITIGQSIFTTSYYYRLVELNGTTFYAQYESGYDRTYTFTSGATIKLDGTYNATYTNGNTVVTGYYELSSGSELAMLSKSCVLTFTATSDGSTQYFLIAEETINEYNEDGTTQKKTVYTAKEVCEGYSEFLFSLGTGNGQTFYHPLLAVNDTAQGHATVYGYTKEGTYVLVSEGTFAPDADTGFYVYTAATYGDKVELRGMPACDDIYDVKSFEFSVNIGLADYPVWYWYTYTTLNDETETVGIVYKSADKEKLTFINGYVIYETAGKNRATATYSVNSAGMYTFTFSGGTIYAELNEDEKTFFLYQSAPYSAYVLLEDGSYGQSSTMSFDGKGGVTYSVTENGEMTNYVGTFTQTDRTTLTGAYIYTFTEKDGALTFDFIQLVADSYRIIGIYNETYHGEYRSADGILTLDGFGFMADYLDANGHRTQGNYVVVEENLIRAVVGNMYRYFDIDGRSFTVRGVEYGSYIIMDNQYANGRYVDFDGHGVATVRIANDREIGEDNDGYDYYTGTYEQNGDSYTIIYMDGAEQVILIGTLDVYVVSSTSAYRVFIVTHSEIVGYYVNEKDWSLLILDGNGEAVRFNKDGKKETGAYLLITDTMLYYVGTSDACIYRYNKATGAATPVTFTQRNYYTDTLESLIFSQYGFAIFNGETQYYYDVVDGNVFIYRKVEEGETADGVSDYGFIVEEFGAFTDEKEYDGKVYHINSGYAIEFSREEATKNDYLVTLVDSKGEEIGKFPIANLLFTPSGSATFSVSGSVYINDQRYTCTVVRTESETYVQVSNFRFYVDLTFRGEDEDGTSNSTYTVTGMRRIISYSSGTYWNMYYSMLYGGMSNVALTMPTDFFGLLELIAEFDTTGEVEREYLNFYGSKWMEIGDLNGPIEAFMEQEFEYDEESKLYTAEYLSEDGYQYNLYFIQTTYTFGQYFSNPCFYLLAFTRLEKFTVGNYTVTAERVIASDYTRYYPTGSFLTIELTEGEEEIELSAGYIRSSNTVYYIVRETVTEGEGDDAATTITGSTYYIIAFAESNVVDEGVVLPAYLSASVEKKTMSVYYGEDGSFIEVDADDNVYLMYRAGYGVYLINTCEFDSETGVYTFETSIGVKFTVTRDSENKITIEEIKEEEEGDETL